VRGSLSGSCADGGRGKVREGEGQESAVQRACYRCVVLGGDVEGEIDEGLAMGFYE
jgi:hypothetical protein